MWWIPLVILALKVADVLFNDDGPDDDIDMDGGGEGE